MLLVPCNPDPAVSHQAFCSHASRCERQPCSALSLPQSSSSVVWWEDEVPSSGCESCLYGSLLLHPLSPCLLWLRGCAPTLQQPREAAELAGKGEPGFYSAVLPGGALQLQARKGEPICPYHWLGFGAFLYLMAGADGGEKVIQNLHFYGNGNELG